MHQGDFSGVHSLFVAEDDCSVLQEFDPLLRIDCQFHWHNQQFSSFDEFLQTLKAKKRKNIRQERRKVEDSGVTIRCLDGTQATAKDWQEFTYMYQKIYDRKYGAPAFNLAFFQTIAKAIPDQIVLVLVDHGEHCIAGALMYRDDHTLYGRHWGCKGYLNSLHFEVCYYQGIDYCIRHQLQRFDPGAQGEHKVARGFVPTETRSFHWIAQPQFKNAIAEFVRREQKGVRGYIKAVKEHSPYQTVVTS